MGDRQYSKTTEAALFALSVKCYEPNCQVPTVSINADRTQKKNVQIAHIVPISPKKPRYRPLPREERDSFANLILLCDAHHRPVDNKANEHIYTEALLLQWKEDAEKDIRSKVDGLTNLTEESLEAMLDKAASSMREDILSAIDSLRSVSEESAEVLTYLFDQVSRNFINHETAALLYAASEGLANLSETASILFDASRNLSYLEEGSSSLLEAANRLGDLEANSNTLYTASQVIGEIELQSAVSKLENFCERYAEMLYQTPPLPDLRSEVQEAGGPLLREIEEKVDRLRSEEPVQVVDHHQRWRFAIGGFVTGVLAALTIAILGSTGVLW